MGKSARAKTFLATFLTQIPPINLDRILTRAILKWEEVGSMVKKVVHPDKFSAIFAWVSLITVTLILFIYYGRLDTGMEKTNLDHSEAKRIATILFFSKLESIGTISMAILGVLWAFVIYTGNKINIHTTGQKSLFWATNLFLLGSFISYYWGFDFLLGRIFYHSTIDLEAPIVQFWSFAQLVYFIFGTISFAVTVFLCREK